MIIVIRNGNGGNLIPPEGNNNNSNGAPNPNNEEFLKFLQKLLQALADQEEPEISEQLAGNKYRFEEGFEKEIDEETKLAIFESENIVDNQEFQEASLEKKEQILGQLMLDYNNLKYLELVYVHLVDILYVSKQWNKLLDMVKALVESPTFGFKDRVYYYKGLLELELDMYADAVETFEQVLKFASESKTEGNNFEYLRQYGYALYFYGATMEEEHLKDRGLIILQRAVNLTPTGIDNDSLDDLQFCLEYEKELGIHLLRTKKYSDALNSFNRVDTSILDTDSIADVKSYLGYTKVLSGKEEEGIKLLKENFFKASPTIKFKTNMKKLLSSKNS